MLGRTRERDPLREFVENRARFMERLHVETKRGKTQAMDDPTLSQVDFARILARPDYREGVFYKPRQVRWTQTNCAHIFQRFFAAQDPIRTLIVTNHTKTTKAVFGKFRTFVRGLPQGLQDWNRIAVNLTDRTLASSHLALIDHLTGGGESHGRSWTYQHIVFEELAFCPNAEEVHAAATQTLDEDGTASYISTSNGPSGLFYEKVKAAQAAMRRGDPGVVYHFERWIDHEEYRKEPPEGWEPDQEEHELMETYGLDLAQIYWRHQKIHGVRGIGLAKFRREYPITEDEGFLIADGCWFDGAYLSAVKASLPEPVVGELRIYEKPQRGMTYVGGVDGSWCNGGDDAVACILNARGKQVAVLAMNEGGEELFAERASELCHAYNHARSLNEYNPGGAGKTIMDIMIDNHVPMWRANPGEAAPKYWTTSHGSKVEAFAYARQMVNGDAYELTDHTTIEQLMNIRELPQPSGLSKIEGAAGDTGTKKPKDDHAMAFVLAAWNLQTVAEPVVHPRDVRRRYVTQRQPAAAVQRYRTLGALR